MSARAKHEGAQALKDAAENARKQAIEDIANGFIKQKAWTRDYAEVIVQHAAQEGVLNE